MQRLVAIERQKAFRASMVRSFAERPSSQALEE
jgi:hypothetical protein